MNCEFKRKLPVPMEIKEMFPITHEMSQIKAKRDMEIADIFRGTSDKFLLIIGPCSADSEEPLSNIFRDFAKFRKK